MEIVYRIQPKGLDIKGHYSYNSLTDDTGDLADGIHVFNHPWETIDTPDCGYVPTLEGLDGYGDEVVVIETPETWDNGDAEGSCIDPEESTIIGRYSFAEWLEVWKKAIESDFPEVREEVKDFYDLNNTYAVGDYASEIESIVKGGK